VEDAKVYEEYLTFPGSYVVHLMVLHETPGPRGRGRRPKHAVYRSRVWIGVEEESDPRLHRSQEHTDLREAVDACWQMLRDSAPAAMDSSTEAMRQVADATGAYFRAEPQPVDA
jgi:hypothetical protein